MTLTIELPIPGESMTARVHLEGDRATVQVYRWDDATLGYVPVGLPKVQTIAGLEDWCRQLRDSAEPLDG